MIRKTTNNTIWASGRQLSLLIPLFLLGGCTAQEDVTEAQQAAYGKLAVNEVVTFADGASTRADATPTATAPPAGSSIGVFRQADTYYTAAGNNVKYTLAADGKWKVATTGTDILLGANDCRALLYAYYPNHGKIAVAADNVSVTMSNRAYDADYDLAYMAAGNAEATDAGGLVYNFHPGVKFPMKRACTQLAVSLTRGGNYGGVGAVTAVSLTLNGGGKLYSSGTQNIATGVYTAGTADVDKVTCTVPANTKITTAAKTATFAQLLPPGKNGTISNLTLTVTADGVTTKTTISTAGLAMEAGKRYLVKATLDYYGLAATIKTTDWDSQTAWDEGVEFLPPPPPAHSIDIGLDFYIADGNLRATKETGSSSYTYAFAEGQGYYSGVDGAYNSAGGDYFCWNWDDPAVTDKNQGSWDDTRDPCRMVDDGKWRTPTQAELQALVDAGNVWGDGAYKMNNGTKKSGRYFGTTTVPLEVDQDKYVFLPAAGHRDGTSWSVVGSDGYYWSSTPDGSNAYTLYFRSGGLYPKDYYDRSRGFSVRCVRDK